MRLGGFQRGALHFRGIGSYIKFCHILSACLNPEAYLVLRYRDYVSFNQGDISFCILGIPFIDSFGDIGLIEAGCLSHFLQNSSPEDAFSFFS